MNNRILQPWLWQRAFAPPTAAALIAVTVMTSGCAKKDAPAETPKVREQIGITFKSGKGLRISDETKKFIGLEVVEAGDQKLATVFTTRVQVYGHRSAPEGTNVAEATGFIAEDQARQLPLGQTVALRRAKDSTPVLGKLMRFNSFTQSALHQVEILIETPDSQKLFPIGTTFEATVKARAAQSVTAIPRSAVLNTSEGTFAYVVNGDYFFRTAIQTGAANAEFAEVKDGLYAGDQVVKQPVLTLWIAELQAIKGGADND